MFLKNVDAVLSELGIFKDDCHSNLSRGKEYRMLKPGGGAVSIEEAMFLVGTIWVTRPHAVIELGTSMGVSALVLAAACKDLGMGEVVTVDLAKDAPITRLIAEKYNLPIKYVCETNSLDYLPKFIPITGKQYLVFSDTDIPVRHLEVQYVIDNFPKGTVVVVHDTSDKHPFGPMKLKEKINHPIVELPSPRGISILRV